MIETIIASVTHLIIQVISSTSYAGIFILMALESALIPIPSEVTMAFSGYLVSIGTFNFVAVVLVGAFANLFGSILAYLLGYWGEETVVLSLIRKYGKYLLISEHEYHKSEKWFRLHGEKIVFFARVLPVVRTFISLPAGIAKMNFTRFCILSFLGSLIWSIFLTYIGVVLGKNWHSLEVYYRKFEYIIIAVIVLSVAYYVWHKVKSARKK
jgi:membrane protein DedA with SNARE-associated domain